MDSDTGEPKVTIRTRSGRTVKQTPGAVFRHQHVRRIADSSARDTKVSRLSKTPDSVPNSDKLVDDGAESNPDAADGRTHRPPSPKPEKHHSSFSESESGTASERDRTPRKKKRFRSYKRNESLGQDRNSMQPAWQPEEMVATPRATLLRPDQIRGDAIRSPQDNTDISDAERNQNESVTFRMASEGVRCNELDRSSVVTEHLLPENEHVHDPRNFYASQSPVFGNSDSDHDFYECAEDFEETFESEDQVGRQVNGQDIDVPVNSSRETLDGSQREADNVIIISLLRQIAENQNRAYRSASTSMPTIRCRRRSPRRRGTEEKGIAKLVRNELDSLLKAEPPYGRIPSPSQLSAFAAEWERTGRGAKACDATVTDFMIDVAGKPKSPWNVSAGRVFASHLIEKLVYDDTEEMRNAIEKAFSNRIKSLQSRHRRDTLPRGEKAADRSKHSRNQRKYQLFHRRREVAKLYEPLQKHLGILDVLGPEGMSSDESDIDRATNQPMYTVVKPDWRHPDLHNWLKVLDHLHHRAHINSWSKDKRGAFAHTRVGSQRVHKKTHAPPHLPLNAYDPLWLEGRETLYIKHVLRPKAELYSFTHSSDVIALLSVQP